MKKIRFFYLKNFRFLEVKFSINLNRHVFVMVTTLDKSTGSKLDFFFSNFRTSMVRSYSVLIFKVINQII